MTNVPPKEWDPPEHLTLSEREFLVDRAETINGIVAASYLQVGQVLLQVKRKFKRDPDLDGWFKQWIDNTLPILYDKALQLSRIAEQVEDDPRIIEATKLCNFRLLYLLLNTPGDAKEHLLQAVLDGVKVTQSDISAIKALPEVELEKLRSDIESMEMTLLKHEMSAAGTTDSKVRASSINNAKRTKERLSKALAKLNQKEEEVNALGKERSTQELVLQTLRKQLNQKEVIIENMNLDPEHKRKRALARTVVDATNGLDLLLSSLDRYGTDKPDLGVEAITTIERKMEEVKTKLLEHYAANLPETGSSP